MSRNSSALLGARSGLAAVGARLEVRRFHLIRARLALVRDAMKAAPVSREAAGQEKLARLVVAASRAQYL